MEGHPVQRWSVREGSLLDQEMAWQEKGIGRIPLHLPLAPPGSQGISDGPVLYQGPGHITTVGQSEWWAFEDRWPGPLARRGLVWLGAGWLALEPESWCALMCGALGWGCLWCGVVPVGLGLPGSWNPSIFKVRVHTRMRTLAGTPWPTAN